MNISQNRNICNILCECINRSERCICTEFQRHFHAAEQQSKQHLSSADTIRRLAGKITPPSQTFSSTFVTVKLPTINTTPKGRGIITPHKSRKYQQRLKTHKSDTNRKCELPQFIRTAQKALM